jgi:ATP-dependent Clp protease adaptor protein ClpS
MHAIRNHNLTDTSDEMDVLVLSDKLWNLVVWKDEVNTFQWVIETLMETCQHTFEQAEQCAYIIHFQGKYAVKKGSYKELKAPYDAITDRAINATIEVIV